MKYNRFVAGLAGQFLILILAVNLASADITRVQTISLHKGWNAVFLQVDPTDPKPADLFQGTPVTIAAAFTGVGKSIQYVQNPSTNSLTQKKGWSVWYAPSRQDAFLTQMFQLIGNKPYLLYAESDYVWSVSGNARLATVTWKPNAFTLTGFGVDDVSPPTFDQFFAGSPAHHPYQIYRLQNDSWIKLDNAQNTQMQSGEAYWIYCTGASAYQGPLAVQPPSGTTFTLTSGDSAGMVLLNNSPNPLNVQVQNMAGGAQLPLAFVLRAVTDTNVTTAAYDLPDTYSMPSFDAGEKRGFWLTLRPERMTVATQTGLLKITTDVGTLNWLPVTGNRSGVAAGN
ncbi:MAG TPA: hypothetical protein VG347_12260 [Verrucomicrobiae bacterium]|nr:hypothetical protein [Verrucomicrobiae bacterium]